MPQIVGLDIGSAQVKGAVFEGSGKRFSLVDFFAEEIPPPQADAAVSPIVEVLKRIAEERDLPGATVIAAVDAKICVLRDMTIPYTRDDQIRKVIYFEAENYLPAWPIEDVIIDHLKVEEVGDRSRLVLAALRKEWMADRLGMLQGAGIDPAAMDLDTAALFNALAMTPAFSEERTTLLLDLGVSSVKIVLIEQGRPKKMRSLRLVGVARPDLAPGGELAPEDPLEARFREMERRLEGPAAQEPSPADAGDEVPPEEGGDSSDDLLIAIMSDDEFDHLSRAGLPDEDRRGGVPAAPPEGKGSGDEPLAYHRRVALEVQRTLAGARLSSPVELVCITGGMSGGPEVRDFFSREFESETVALDFRGCFPSEVTDETLDLVNQTGAVAVGLAAKSLRRDRLGFDFRKGEFRYERHFERLRVPLMLTGAVTFIMFLLLSITLWRDQQRLQSAAIVLREWSLGLYQTVFDPDRKDRISPQEGGYGAAQRKLALMKKTTGTEVADVPEYDSPFDILIDITEGLEKSGVYPMVRSIDVITRKDGQSKTQLVCSVGGFEESTKLRQAFLAELKRLDLGDFTPRPDPQGNYNVTAHFTLKEKFRVTRSSTKRSPRR